jgi:glucose-1-phosphate cytidylyltransferase
MFLANYGDTLTDAPLDHLVDEFRQTDAVASFLSVRPTTYPIRVVVADDRSRVTRLASPGEANLWVNGGYFLLRHEIFEFMEPGDELVEAPFRRLIDAGRLRATRYEGFWGPLDTLRDLEHLQSLEIEGHAPWGPWEAADPVGGGTAHSAGDVP